MSQSMTVDTIDLSDIRNLGALLERLPQGSAVRTLATRLGVWTAPAHDGASNRKKPYPSDYSQLTDDQMSATYGYWVSELSRATELVGLLEGVRKLVDLIGKQHRATARATIRREFEAEAKAALSDGKKVTKPTATEISDRAEESEAVRDTDQLSALLLVTTPSASAYKEACLATVTGLSREISFRQAAMGMGRVR